MIREIAWMAARNIRHQKTRANITILGIVIGIAAIVALVSLGQSLQGAIDTEFAQLGTDTIYLSPANNLGAASVFARIREEDLELIRQINGVKDVVPFYETAATAKYRNEEKGIFLIGIEPHQWSALDETGFGGITAGRPMEPNDEFVILLPERSARNMFDKPLGLRERVEIKGRQYRIIGFLKESESGLSGLGIFHYGYVPAKTVQTEFNEKEATEGIVQIQSGATPSEVAAKIEDRFLRKYNDKRVNAQTNEALAGQAAGVIGAVQGFLGAIAALALLVGGLGIANTTLMNVLERYREIGTMKALGATKHTILGIFLAEAMLMGAIGGLIGSLVGLGLSALVSHLAKTAGFNLPFTINYAAIAGAILFAMLVGMIAGFIPARRGANLDPVESLRYE